MADNFDSVRKKRMEELEAKKRRLEEMRKSKKERETEDVPPPAPLPASKSQADSRAEVDDLVKSLLGGTSAASASSSSSSPAVKASASSATTMIFENGICTSCGKPEHLLPAPPAPAPIVLDTPPPPPPPPMKPESYDKNTQTDPPSEVLAADSLDEGENDVCPACRRGPPSPSRSGHRRRLGSGAGSALDEDGGASRRGSQPTLGAASASASTAAAADAAIASSSRVPLTPDQEVSILQSPEFGAFLQRSARVMERVLHQSGDPLKDYRSEQYGAGQRGAEGTSMSLLRGMADPAALGRPVTALAFSPHHPELFCAAFGASPSDDSFPGCVLVFSTAFPGPEFCFSATSPVLCAAFHPTDPHLLLGACYSGQVLCWDMRGGDRGAAHPTLPRAMEPPLQRRASATGHKHPVYAMSFATPGAGASSSALELLTVSTDGCLCHWDVSVATLKVSYPPQFSLPPPRQHLEPPSSIFSYIFSASLPPLVALGPTGADLLLVAGRAGRRVLPRHLVPVLRAAPLGGRLPGEQPLSSPPIILFLSSPTSLLHLS